MPLLPEPNELEKLPENSSLPNPKTWLKKPQGSDK
jgi:hypothetical protein